jgi:hypothetical protein
MKIFLACLLAAGAAIAQDAPKLKSRTDVPPSEPPTPPPGPVLVVPAGTKIPISLKQPVSTSTARPGDAIYGQTSFPILVSGLIAIPAGTWVQGVVDSVKRAGRIKGTAELRFHLTQLIFQNGYSLSMRAAIDHVPGESGVNVEEPDTVKESSEKEKDVGRIMTNASTAGGIGALAGAAVHPTIRGFGVGGVAGIAAGTLIGVLARGSDVRFDVGTAVEVALNQAIGIDREQASRAAN